jgi:triacylglycerol lipase
MTKLPAILLLGQIACLGCSTAVSTAPPPQSGGGVRAAPGPTLFPPGVADAGPQRSPYPIIFAAGFAALHNTPANDYFKPIANLLKQNGHDAWVSSVDPYNDSYVRGAQLQAFVEVVLAQTGAERVNLICHSQGGLDGRYVASKLPGKVAAIVTISSPHRGVPVADVATGAVPGALTDAVAALMNLFGAGDYNSNAKAGIVQLSSAGAAAFTAKVADDPTTHYYSLAGRSNGSNGDDDCASDNEVPFIGRYDNGVDTLNLVLSASAAIANGSAMLSPTNDGLVTVASSKYGMFLGCVPADHLDETGQSLTLSGNPFDPNGFYLQLADWLVARGY